MLSRHDNDHVGACSCDSLPDNHLSASREEFTRHFEACRERIWNLLRFHLHAQIGARVEPDDVLQDVYIAALQRFSTYSPKEFPSFFLWIRTIALQTLHNVHRFHYSQKRTALREKAFDFRNCSLQDHDLFVASITSPSQRAMRKELFAKIRSSMDSLSDKDREIIVLRHFEELTNAEAAVLLNLSERAASVRYIRAISRLRSGVSGTGSPHLLPE